MADTKLLGKHQLEKALYDEHKAISAGRLKEENPLDTSSAFRVFCEACRRGDLARAQEQIGKGVNINARDEFDYTPLILVSGKNKTWRGERAAGTGAET
jgi:ankyrin repeat and BTB/POZ domain-containing protein 1